MKSRNRSQSGGSPKELMNFTNGKEIFDVTANYTSRAVVRRGRRLLRVFQMGKRREPRGRRNGPAYSIGRLLGRRVALISFHQSETYIYRLQMY